MALLLDDEDWNMKLRYYIPVEKSSGYSTRNVLKRFNREDFSHRLKADFNGNQQLQGYISTQVWGFLFWKRWVLVLDCDSIIDRDRAIEEIRSMDLKYDVMESSPEKFWIIVNYTGSFRKCINLMCEIPGVDTNFISKCERDRKIVLRAFPKNGYVPGTINDPYSECHGRVKDWFYSFRNWWRSGTVEWLANHQRVEIQRIAILSSSKIKQSELEAIKTVSFNDVKNSETKPEKKKLRLIRLEKENSR
jgi:hypothetical protein